MLGTGVFSRTKPLAARQVSGPRSVPVQSDEELARRLQQGRAEALETLLERHHNPLLGYLYRLTGGDRPLAEDLTQEAFLRVLRSINQYFPPRPFKPWLYAIATNTARDFFKSADRRYTDSLLEDFDTPAEDTDPAAGLLAADDARRVAWAMGCLPAHQREAVLLRYYQDLPLSDIAEALSVPVGTVKSRLSLGLKRMKELLREG